MLRSLTGWSESRPRPPVRFFYSRSEHVFQRRDPEPKICRAAFREAGQIEAGQTMRGGRFIFLLVHETRVADVLHVV